MSTATQPDILHILSVSGARFTTAKNLSRCRRVHSTVGPGLSAGHMDAPKSDILAALGITNFPVNPLDSTMSSAHARDRPTISVDYLPPVSPFAGLSISARDTYTTLALQSPTNATTASAGTIGVATPSGATQASPATVGNLGVSTQ